MPALLIPIITSALSATALSSTAIAATAFISANVIVAGAALGLNALLSPSTDQKVASQQFQSRQAMPSLLYGYGVSKLGGTKFEFDTGQGIYVDGIIHSAGPVNRIVKWMLNDTDAAGFTDASVSGGVAGGTNTALPWGAAVVLDTHKGINTTPPGSLVSVLPGRWTTDHRLDGMFYTVMSCLPTKERDFQKSYPNGPPAVYVVAELAPVYDPRDGAQSWSNPTTWKYSDNVALAILHYLTAIRGTDSITGQPVPYGFGFSQTQIDLPSFIAYANVCDQNVALKAGGSEKRYRIGGTYDMGAEERRTVLNRLLSTGDAEIYQGANGKIAVRGGVWTAPTVTIKADHILGYDFEGGADKLATFNRLKINFCDPKNDYQVIEADPWDDLASQLASPNGVIAQDLSLPMVQSHGQARRLAKIATAKANPTYKLTLTTDLYGLLALGERTISVVLPELGISGTFLVTAFTEAADGTCKIGISSLGPEAYAWTPASEEGIAPAVADSTKQPTIVPDIVSPVLAVERFTSNGAVTVIGVKVTVNAPTDTNFGLIGRARIVGSGTAGWVDMSDVGNLWSLSYRPVNEGQIYEVQVAFKAPFNGTQGPWVAAGTVTTTADTTAPNAPTYNSATLSADAANASHEFRQSDSSNARSVQILQARGVGKTITDASIVATVGALQSQVVTANTPIGLGLYRFYIKAVNGSGIVSAAAATSRTIINSMQPANLTTAPYDFTNAAWVKTRLGTPTIASNSPDSNASTLVPEQASANSHYVSQAVSITSGKRVQFAIGVRANGRTKGRIDLFDSSLVSYVRATFDLTAGTISVVSTSGSIISAGTAELTQVSSNWSIVSISGVVAATGVEGRLLFADDTGSASYTGDTTKGMYLWGGTIAMVN